MIVKKKPIRVLHVLTAMNMAGTETLLMNLFRNIDRDSVQFDFAVSATSECAYDKEIEELGGRIYHYPCYKGINHVSYVNWWHDFLNSHPEYIIVHGHIGSTAAIYLRVAKRLGRMAIAHSHSTNSTLSLHSVLYSMFSFPTRYIADFFFGCSMQALIDRYGRRVANNEEISRVLKNAIDASKFRFDPKARNTIRRQYNTPQNGLVLGTVGRLTAQKNPYAMLRICLELKKRNLDYVFWWFGAGEMENEIRCFIEENALSDHVRLMGTRPDVHNILQGMDVFLFPSVWEGLGIACVEAQTSGLPTLCSDVIPPEAQITENCRFLKLNDTSLWCDVIEETVSEIESEGYQRPDCYEQAREAGYDIRETASWLVDFYRNKAQELM